MSISISDLQSLCNSGSVRWTVHMLQRLIQRNISQDEVIEAIQSGEIIELYPNDYPYPSCLVLGITIAGKYLHVVCGRGVEEVWMISAYSPNPAEWEADLKTRKKVSQ